MSLSVQDRGWLEKLIGHVVDGTLADTQAGELSALLTNNEDARAYYLLYMSIHSGLMWKHQFVGDIAHASPGLLPPALHSPFRLTHFTFPKLLRASTNVCLHPIALVLLVGLVAAGWVVYASWHPAPPQPVVQTPPLASQPVLLASAEQAQWIEGFAPGKNGPLQPGQRLQLVRGTVELKFPGNAKVAVQSPADFKIVDGDTCWLESGKLTAHVPQQARGFEVLTPAVRTVDLGTRFVLEVDKRGVGLEVVEGRVRMEPRPALSTTASASFEPLLLHGGEAARLDGNSGRLTRVANFRAVAAYQKLVLRFGPTVYLPMERSQHEDRQLDNLAGDARRQPQLFYKGNAAPFALGRVGSALALTGSTAASGAYTPISVPERSLTLTAWVCLDQASDEGPSDEEQVIALGQWNGTRGGFRLHVAASGELSAVVWEMVRKVNHRAVTLQESGMQFPQSAWQHVALVASDSEVVMYRNGQAIAKNRYGGLFAPWSDDAAVSIGSSDPRSEASPAKNGWRGRIDEVALYPRALTAEEIHQLASDAPPLPTE